MPATIVLTVGSDCAIGKKTVAVELDLEARRRGLKSVFVPTGQTGIAIAGWGIAVDAVISDFLAGAAEWLVVEGARRGGELLFVEGQGSLVAPGLLGRDARARARVGAAPVRALPQGRLDRGRGLPRPPAAVALRELVELHERISLPAQAGEAWRRSRSTRPTWTTTRRGRRSPRRPTETGLPADDPVRFGAGRLVAAVTGWRSRAVRC